jgi:hypothetical protein
LTQIKNAKDVCHGKLVKPSDKRYAKACVPESHYRKGGLAVRFSKWDLCPLGTTEPDHPYRLNTYKNHTRFGAETGIQIRSRSGFSEAGDRCEKEESGHCLKSPNGDSFEAAKFRSCCKAASDPMIKKEHLGI